MASITTYTRLSSDFDPSFEMPIKPKLEPHHVEIFLDEQEEKLFQVLVQAIEAFHNNKRESIDSIPLKPQQRIEIRVAGGWVRDKLLGLQTHDVDIAVDHMTGVEFATIVQEYCKSQHHLDLVGRMGVIKANPDQSKHLETATMKVCGIEVDFCNLRGETYGEHSRIPTVTFGGPKDDAFRRDFTCNALFYNLKSKSVEDFTGRGLKDLIEGVLVTPLEPVQTFRDDPLRVLRAIRFSVRYNFSLDPALEEACRLDEIHKALHKKVSRERVGKELEGMLSGKDAKPIKALRTISRLKLAGSVFVLPQVGIDRVSVVEGMILNRPHLGHNDSPEARHAREIGWEEANVLLDRLPAVLESFNSIHPKGPTSYDSRLLSIAVFLAPFRYLFYEVERKNGTKIIAAQYVFRDGIKFKNQDIISMSLIQERLDTVIQFIEDASKMGALSVKRLEAGLLLRDLKATWITSLLVATCVLVRRDDSLHWCDIMKGIYASIIEQCLDECWKIRPLLDGKKLIETLNLPRGPEVGIYLDEQMRWMLDNPQGSLEECEIHLLSVKRQVDEGNLTLLGVSDGRSPVAPARKGGGNDSQHFSKKIHVE